MNTDNSLKKIDFISPVRVRIEVKGVVDKSYSDYLNGLVIRHHTSGDKIRYTGLEGEVADQAALLGVLNTLYEMRFPLISISVKK